MPTVTIQLAKYSDQAVGVLAGRDRGEFVREREHIPQIDTQSDTLVIVEIPDWVFSVNTSFILGMLADSVRTLGAEEFRRRFTITGPNGERVREDLIRKALLTGVPLSRRSA